jgi:molybdopterin-guanine dinucleotide biosynthesis protein A
VNPAPFDVVIVAGGASRRMGADKAEFSVDGATLLERAVAAATSAGGVRVVIVGRGAVSTPPVIGIPDSVPGSGPLGALVDGLGFLTVGVHDPSRVIVVVAVDHPDLDPDELAALAALLSSLPSTTLAVVPDIDGRAQPLHAAYRLGVLPALDSAFVAGERSLWRALGNVAVDRPDRSHSGEASSYVDVDDPVQWAAYLDRRQSSRTGHTAPSDGPTTR